MFLETVFVKLQLIVAAVIAAAATPAASATPTTLCSLQDDRITESSGVAVDGDVLWTHNDSGDRARFFALDRHCRTLATYDVSNETATDWEDMARGVGSLWFGDIGDNASTRSEIAIVRVPEPRVSKGTTPCARPSIASGTPMGRTMPRRCSCTRGPGSCSS